MSLPKPSSTSMESNILVTPLVASAPSTPKCRSVPSNSSGANVKRSSSCVDSKYKCSITSERLSRLRKIVESAVSQHKIFTIKGCWPIIRRELLNRNWIEKYEPNASKAKSSLVPNTEDLISNLPAKQEWESSSAYVEKCEKTIMSRMLQGHDVDFYWNMRKDQSDLMHRSNSYKIMNRFNKSLFASKEGLALLLQQHYWYTEPGVSAVNFPRCYVLGFPDHFNNFVEDFRITACMGLLKWVVFKYGEKTSIHSPDGTVDLANVQFAIERCLEFVEMHKHKDIDKEYLRVLDNEWNSFLGAYYSIMHKNAVFTTNLDQSVASLNAKSKNVLNEIVKFYPESHLDGMKNIWILKPGNKCRGRGIHLVKDINDVEKVVNLKLKYVVQKYIERPLLIHNTKFDIRQWFIVANAQPLTIWMYRENYLRFSSQIFTLDNFHESLHLTNHAVQCKYPNVAQRNKALPQDNMWDCHTFQAHLLRIGAKNAWEEIILPGMRESIICAMLSSQEMMDRRQNTFELYGADFMISDDYKPWLIEINCSPDLSSSTSVTARMCPQCMEDLVKVVVDRRRDACADTGLFELIYRQNLPRIPPYLGMNLSVRGRRLFRNKAKPVKAPPKTKDLESVAMPKKLDVFVKSEKRRSTAPMSLPKLKSGLLYKGPVIEDLIEGLNKNVRNCRTSLSNTKKSEPVMSKKRWDSGKLVERKSKRKRKQ